MVIHVIDDGLESLLRVAVPLPRESADVAFDPPDKAWGARVNRMTVNLFLYDVGRAEQPPLPAEDRVTADGRIERRGPLPSVRLSYLVTAWASDVRDEHHLLGEVMACILAHAVLPPEHLPAPMPGAVGLRLADRSGRRPGDIWSALDGRLRPGFELEVTAAVETTGWLVAAPEVTVIEGRASGLPVAPRAPVAASAVPEGERTTLRRRAGASVVTEGRRRPAET